MLSTPGVETRSYEAKDIEKAVAFLVARHARVNAIIVSARPGDSTRAAAQEMTQPIVALPTTKATGGRYESLAASSRLTTLMPEWGRDLAVLHARQIKQFRVTVERARGGDLQSPRIELARPGLTGEVTLDGYLP